MALLEQNARYLKQNPRKENQRRIWGMSNLPI